MLAVAYLCCTKLCVAWCGLMHQCTADASDALVRQARDTALADALNAHGVSAFVESWYRQPMWASLITHPRSVYMCL